ncbi:WXG100 family type VII secretion target [Nocardioides sp. JQ2195]|uniref:WXG100 family type VII secretion target n=1 Tax=Nocardioides sp. JQ2195 TaxID=2592334 RepID=UPI00143E1F12|nr:WXG100 family type VII secretion target [Nocardioides sp. JQ2195]QIX28285.1 WXG100 family type VII secretion target [Nocardioides sp. JQ2195]
MTGHNIAVGYEDLDGAAATIKNRAIDIEDKLNAMERRMIARKDEWTGDASNAFDESRADWEGAMNDMKNVLNDIGHQVGLSNQEYQAAEAANARRFR